MFWYVQNVVVIVAAVVVIAGCGVESSHSSTNIRSPSGNRPTSKEGGQAASLNVGGDCILSAKGHEVFIYRNYPDMDEGMTYLMANDEVGLKEMVLDGKLLICPHGTPAKLIENGILARRVRITGGDFFVGEDGWVAAEFVLPASRKTTIVASTELPKKQSAEVKEKKSVDREGLAASRLRLAEKLIDVNNAAAKRRLNELIDEFPDTDAAQEAAELLVRIRQNSK